MKTSKISFTIEYAGLHLQVLKNDKGEDVTPLKPISDLFGLVWKDQRKKVTATPSQMRRFGISGGDNLPSDAVQGEGIPPSERDARGHGPELFIRLDRVAAYLMSINPEKVRVGGNADGADFLDRKQDEWADALHDYEQLGAAFNLQHAKAQEAASKACMRLAQLVGIRNKTEAPKDRAVISQIMARMATDLGITYQPDLLDGPA